jgi:hypothetical protein
VLAVLACVLVTVAFLDVDVGGFFVGTYGGPYYFSGPCQACSCFHHGWPTAFAEHAEDGVIDPYHSDCEPGTSLPLGFLEHCNPFMWTAFRFTNVKTAILGILLHVSLIAATGVAVFRLGQRRWKPLQLSIADMLSLTAIVGMILGLVCLDQAPLFEEWYLPLRSLPLFDWLMTLFAIACAVGLIVSTVIGRLGVKKGQ